MTRMVAPLRREVLLPNEERALVLAGEQTMPLWKRLLFHPLRTVSDWLFGPPGPYDWMI